MFEQAASGDQWIGSSWTLPNPQRRSQMLTLILIILVLILLFGGGWGYSRRGRV
jgi:hypothetical protein